MFPESGGLSQYNILANPMAMPTAPNLASTFVASGSIPSAPMGGDMGGGFVDSMGGGLGIARAGLAGLSTLGSLWMGLKAAKLAKKQFKFTKDVTNTNLANQIQSYNTALADRARSRGVMEGQTQDQVSGYISANALSRDSARNGASPTSAITSAALSNYSSSLRPPARDPENEATAAG